VLTTFLAAVVQALAVSEPPAAEDPQAVQEQNRRLLEKWRADPDHYARLKRDEKAFREMSPERQARLRQFDRDLHTEDSATQARLWAVLDRYVTWLEKLPESDRAWIDSAPDTKTKLDRVKVIRDQQWVARLPRQVQKDLSELSEEKRIARVAELRREERQRRLEWFWASHARDASALKRARPTRLVEFPPEVRFYFNTSLVHVVSAADKDHLRQAEGNWPLYARTLAKVMETPHPKLPGYPNAPVWPKRFQELPQEYRNALIPFRLAGKGPNASAMKGKKDDVKQRQEEWKSLQSHADKWPDYAVAVTHFVRVKRLKVDAPLGPSRLDQFALPVQSLVKGELLPQLNAVEKSELASEEGKWPEYPEKLLKAAEKHVVAIPGMVRPGPKEFWEAMSKVLPDVPDRTLRNFVLTELTAEERSELKLSPDDISSRERMIETYWARHVDLLHAQLRPRPRKPKQ
jgi:hypothetical protein